MVLYLQSGWQRSYRAALVALMRRVSVIERYGVAQDFAKCVYDYFSWYGQTGAGTWGGTSGGNEDFRQGFFDFDNEAVHALARQYVLNLNQQGWRAGYIHESNEHQTWHAVHGGPAGAALPGSVWATWSFMLEDALNQSNTLAFYDL
jgi:hypothetical protein